MPKPKRGPRLGAGPAHQKLLLSNQAQELFRHGRIKTTHAKAKQLRPYAERLITKAKQGDLHARRQVLAKVRDRDVVAYLFEDIAPRFADRPGGYTRILKLGPRAGDAAPMAIIELVDQGAERGEEVIEEAKRGRTRGIFGRRRRRRDEPVEAGFAEDLDLEDDLDLQDDLDLEDVEDDTEAPSDVPTEQPPGEDLKVPDEQREITPDAGDTTGGTS